MSLDDGSHEGQAQTGGALLGVDSRRVKAGEALEHAVAIVPRYTGAVVVDAQADQSIVARH
jgi:hypothetical protein